MLVNIWISTSELWDQYRYFKHKDQEEAMATDYLHVQWCCGGICVVAWMRTVLLLKVHCFVSWKRCIGNTDMA